MIKDKKLKKEMEKELANWKEQVKNAENDPDRNIEFYENLKYWIKNYETKLYT